MRIQGASNSFNSHLKVEVNASKTSGGFAESLKAEENNIKKTSKDTFAYNPGSVGQCGNVLNRWSR